MKSEGSQMIDIVTMGDGVKKYITLNNVLYLPDLLYNVMSVSQAWKRHLKVVFADNWSMGSMGMVERTHKTSGEVKMIGMETSDGDV